MQASVDLAAHVSEQMCWTGDYRQVQRSNFLSGVWFGWGNNRWKTIAFADNLFDERCATLVRTSESLASFGARSDVAVLGQPRTYDMQVRYDY